MSVCHSWIFKMLAKHLCLLFIGLFSKLNVIFSDDDCQVTQKPKLQIIFIRDPVLKVYEDGQKLSVTQNLTAFHLIDFFKENNFQAEYAVAGFADYPDTAEPRIITDPEICYFLMEKFSVDKDKIVSAITKNVFPPGSTNHSNQIPGGDSKGSLTTAMVFAAVDKQLKWNSGFLDRQGNPVRKIMILMIHRDFTRALENPGNRKPPKADGRDTCATALIPDIEQVNQVLWDNQFILVNSFLKLPPLISRENELSVSKSFSRLFVPYYEVPVPDEIHNVFYPDKFDAKAYAKKLYDTIAQEVMSCDWEDPVGYNSLGL